MIKSKIIEDLDQLQQECAEVIHIAAKIKKFGPASYHPEHPSVNNVELLEQELGDVLAAIDQIKATLKLDDVAIDEYAVQKHVRLDLYRKVDWRV